MNQTMKNQPAIIVGDYSELREHEIRETRMVMVDGGLTVNLQTTEGGTSARVFDRGYWGFASTPRATTGECVSLLELLDETCKRRYPTLTSAKFMIHDETHHKALSNSPGSDVVNCMDQMLSDISAISRETLDTGDEDLPWIRIGGLHFS